MAPLDVYPWVEVEPNQTPTIGRTFWDLCSELLQLHGVIAIVLIALSFLFYRLIWKVWNEAMVAKEKEIARIATERDKYQSFFFDRLRSSSPPVVESSKKAKS